MLLLDPYDIEIKSPTQNMSAGPNYTATASPAQLAPSDIVTSLNTSNVTVSTSGAFTESGDITVTDAISSTETNKLTFNADRNVTINTILFFLI